MSKRKLGESESLLSFVPQDERTKNDLLVRGPDVEAVVDDSDEPPFPAHLEAEGDVQQSSNAGLLPGDGQPLAGRRCRPPISWDPSLL